MRIAHVHLPVPDPASSAAFYTQVLGAGAAVAASGGQDATAVQLGTTTLTLVHDDAADPSVQHLAFNVPGDAAQRAHDWLSDRVPVLQHEGNALLDGPITWDSQSVYFRAADGAVLELIARRRLPVQLGSAPFGPNAILGVSEVGLVVPDAPAAATRLERTFGISAFGAAPSADFGAVGDDEGLFILARSGRTWFPTADAVALPSPLRIEIEGAGADATDVIGASTVSTVRSS